MQNFRFIALIGLSVYLLSCDKKVDKISLSNEYLPLETGNYWQLSYTEKKEVVGTKTIGNKIYYSLKFLNDTSYYRIENDKVYVIEYNSSESVKFNLSAKVNDTWQYNGYTVKLTSKTDTITIKNTKIANCYRFYFDVPGMADEEHSITLAPGIGFIQEQCGFCIYPVRKLERARIGEQVIEY